MDHPLLSILLLLAPAAQADLVSVDANGRAGLANRGSSCQDARDDCASVVGDNLEWCGTDPSGILQQCLATCQACAYRQLVEEAMQCQSQCALDAVIQSYAEKATLSPHALLWANALSTDVPGRRNQDTQERHHHRSTRLCFSRF